MRVYYFVLRMDFICVGSSKTVVLVQDYSPDVDGLSIWSGEGPGQWNGQLAESGYGMVRETESRVSQELEDIEGPREIHWANPRTGGGDVDALVGVDVSQAPERPRSAQKRAGEKPGLVPSIELAAPPSPPAARHPTTSPTAPRTSAHDPQTSQSPSRHYKQSS